MRIKVTISPDNTVQVAALEGEFTPASAAVVDLLRRVGARGVKFAEQSEPEQHRHDIEGVAHVHSHSR